jgi:peptide/nickel transport system substrate-binding protein
MRRIAFLRAVAASLAAPALAQRPRYGGTLIVETRARAAYLDSNDASVDLRRVGACVFEGLVGRDEVGGIRPQLATAWSHDAQKRQWRFAIRPNVKAHDGTAITPALIAAALSRVLAPRVLSASPDSLTIQGDDTLIEDLAEPRCRLAWKTFGTGPFKLASWIAGQRGVLTAHESHWQGRPYLNAIEIRMGRSLREQLFDFEGGRADIVELTLADSRRLRTAWTSAPLDLVALAFVRNRAGVQDERVRRGIALAIDRAPIAQVLLQRLGEAAGSFVPQSVSGYGFLFGTDRDLDRAMPLLKPAPPPLVLAYDAAEPSLRLIAERIALNAREAGAILKPSSTDEPDLVLIRVSATATDPGLALAEYGRGLQMPLPVFGRSREEVWQAERRSLVGGWVVPLFHVPAAYGVRTRVRNWVKPGAVWWKLDEVWLEGDR